MLSILPKVRRKFITEVKNRDRNSPMRPPVKLIEELKRDVIEEERKAIDMKGSRN